MSQSIILEGVDAGARRSPLSVEPITCFDPEVKTPYEGFLRGVRIAGDKPCLGTRGGPENKYQWITYNEVHERATHLGSGLIHLGCEPGQSSFVGIYAPNCTEWDLADFACQMYSMISVPIYDTHGAEGCVYIINHADIETIICNKSKIRFIFDNASKCKGVKRIVKIDEPVSDDESKEAASLGINMVHISDVEALGKRYFQAAKPGTPDDIMTICYTSGTTGTPKGAMLTNKNINADISGIQMHYDQVGEFRFSTEDSMISYLPLAHMYERLAQGLCFFNGIRIGFFQGDVKALVNDIQELKPTIFPCVPRLLTRIYDKVMAQVSQSKLKSWLFQKGLDSKEADLKQGIIRGDTFWDRFVFKKIRMLLGGNVRIITSGAAPLSTKVMTFFRCILGDCLVLEGYGQTETAAAATFSSPKDTSLGHVGPPLPCNLIKLTDVPEKECYAKDGKGEICMKGPNVFKGYLKAPEKTAETIDKDGWLHSGDIGEWLPNGTLKIIDRVKHIFKLAQGEYVAPEKIENIYLRSSFVAQAFVTGESLRSFVVAIIIPDPEVLEPWARSKKIQGDLAELCQNEEVKKVIFEDILQKGKEGKLNSFEQVKAIHLHEEMFSVENSFLTPTFKTKRPVVSKAFDDKFQELYKQVTKRVEYERSTSLGGVQIQPVI